MLIFVVNSLASILTVTTLADTDDNICDSHCSLREAVKSSATGDMIIFARALRGGTIELTKTLFIDKRITIDGPNRRRITLKGNNTFRIIEIKGAMVTLDGLIIRDGNELNGDGDGIYVNPAVATVVNLTNVAVLNNTAQHGGGIYITFGTLYLTDSTIANNVATAENSGAGLDITRSTFYAWNSTISGNVARSTVDGAGGIRIDRSDSWTIRESTIAYNVSNGQSSSSAGGIVAYNGIPGALCNTIVAKNTGISPDLYGRTGVSLNSLIGVYRKDAGYYDGADGNIVGTVDTPADPQLAPLADNGGDLPTHALLSGSRAIDAGKNELATDRHGDLFKADERGFNRIVNSTVDMGAYEYNSAPTSFSSTITGQVTAANGRGVYGARVTLRDASGGERFALTNPFGFYRFVNVPGNSAYQIECSGKRSGFFTQSITTEGCITPAC